MNHSAGIILDFINENLACSNVVCTQKKNSLIPKKMLFST